MSGWRLPSPAWKTLATRSPWRSDNSRMRPRTSGRRRRGMVPLGDRANPLDEMVDLDLGSVELDDEQGLDIERIAHLDEGLGGGDRRLVHHLHAARDDAGGDDRGDAVAGLLVAGESEQQGPRRLRPPQDAHGDLGDDAEQPLRAGHQAEQVVAL